MRATFPYRPRQVLWGLAICILALTAASLLGQSFARLGEREMAWNMHRRAIRDLEVERDNLDLFYQMARFLEESRELSDRTEAQKIYADILEVNYSFRDAKARHDRLP